MNHAGRDEVSLNTATRISGKAKNCNTDLEEENNQNVNETFLPNNFSFGGSFFLNLSLSLPLLQCLSKKVFDTFCVQKC